jgi:hypothetical protein
LALPKGTSTHVPKTERTVTYWPKPSPDGDGEDVYRDVTDDAGNYLGREAVTVPDAQGNPVQVRHHLPPEGFIRIGIPSPGSDGQSEAYVRASNHGGIARNAKGEAIGIKPGSALVEYGDGTHELLTDDWSMRQFELAHNRKDGGS